MKKLHFLVLTTTFVSCMFISACSTVGKSEPWYLGSFTGEMPDVNEVHSINLKCASELICEFSLKQPKSKSPDIIKTTTSEPINVLIPNNNLLLGRRQLQDDPKHYEDPREGGLLRQLRPIFEGSYQFTDCKSIGDMMVFCLASDKNSKKPIPVVGMITMKSGCGNSPFCAYYFIPLKKEKK